MPTRFHFESQVFLSSLFRDGIGAWRGTVCARGGRVPTLAGCVRAAIGTADIQNHQSTSPQDMAVAHGHETGAILYTLPLERATDR